MIETLASLQNHPDIGFFVAVRDTITYANNGLASILGFPGPEDIVGASLTELFGDISTGHTGHSQAIFTAGERTTKPLRSDLNVHSSAGAALAVRLYAITQNSEASASTVGIVLDRSLEERVAVDVLQAQRLESVGRLAGGVAHDFNNIMSVITSLTRVLRDERRLQLDEAGRTNLVTQIEEAAERASSLTRQLLTFSRRAVRNPERTNVGLVITELSRLLERLIGANITLLIATEGSLPIVSVDVPAFEQAIVNLVVNARDAMPNGGSISIKVAEGRIARPNEPRGERCVVVDVSDTGTGMDDDTRLRAVEPFFTTKPAGQGTGLGLSTVHGFVTAAGGAMEISSRINEGTVVRLFVPAVRDEDGPR